MGSSTSEIANDPMGGYGQGLSGGFGVGNDSVSGISGGLGYGYEPGIDSGGGLNYTTEQSTPRGYDSSDLGSGIRGDGYRSPREQGSTEWGSAMRKLGQSMPQQQGLAALGSAPSAGGGGSVRGIPLQFAPIIIELIRGMRGRQ